MLQNGPTYHSKVKNELNLSARISTVMLKETAVSKNNAQS